VLPNLAVGGCFLTAEDEIIFAVSFDSRYEPQMDEVTGVEKTT
jgi:hypothetical protein